MNSSKGMLPNSEVEGLLQGRCSPRKVFSKEGVFQALPPGRGATPMVSSHSHANMYCSKVKRAENQALNINLFSTQ